MSLLFMDAYLCHEVHMGILHLTAAVCPWWHPHVALGLFQWSHTQACHISLVNAWDFSALLQPHSSSLNWRVEATAGSKKQEAIGTSSSCLLEGMSSEGALGAHGMGLVTAWCWQSKWGFSGHHSHWQMMIWGACEVQSHNCRGCAWGRNAAWHHACGQPL